MSNKLSITLISALVAAPIISTCAFHSPISNNVAPIAFTSQSFPAGQNQRLAVFEIQATEGETDSSATTKSVFVAETSEESKSEETVEDTFDAVEKLGRGSAKAKRGKRKGGAGKDDASTRKAAATLAPEEVFYEGPPAITETIAPTASILTVVGIIPAAAAWARQAWVRYKITTRRIRVTSGVGGKDMAEIVYPDITEIRTAKRLFGDGDLVAFLKDGAKFEMRNIPNFEETMEFILKQVDKDVAKAYRKEGDVTNP